MSIAIEVTQWTYLVQKSTMPLLIVVVVVIVIELRWYEWVYFRMWDLPYRWMVAVRCSQINRSHHVSSTNWKMANFILLMGLASVGLSVKNNHQWPVIVTMWLMHMHEVEINLCTHFVVVAVVLSLHLFRTSHLFSGTSIFVAWETERERAKRETRCEHRNNNIIYVFML